MTKTRTKVFEHGGKKHVCTWTSCRLCNSCWLFSWGVCIYEGPFDGYVWSAADPPPEAVRQRLLASGLGGEEA